MKTPTPLETKCSHCGGGSFVVVHSAAPSDGLRGLSVVQCSACGVPIGVVACPDLDARLAEQARLIEGMSTRLGHLEETLGHVLNLLRYE